MEHKKESLMYLTEKDVKKILQISLPTLRRWRAKKEGPAAVKINRLVRYTEASVEAYVNRLAKEQSVSL